MNYTQIVGRAKRESGRTGPPPAGIATAVAEDRRIYDWVADAWRDLQTEGVPWRFMRRTATAPLIVGQSGYTNVQLGIEPVGHWLPEGQDYFPTVFEATNPLAEWPLRWASYDSFRRHFLVGGHSPATPQFWSVAPDGGLLIGPTPDKAYTLRADYQRATTELTADIDTPDLPVDYHMVLVWMAVMQIAGLDAAPEVFIRGQGNLMTVRNALWRDQGPAFRTVFG